MKDKICPNCAGTRLEMIPSGEMNITVGCYQCNGTGKIKN